MLLNKTTPQNQFLKCLFPSRRIVESGRKSTCYGCCVWLFATPWTPGNQASLFFALSWSLLKFMSIESVIRLAISSSATTFSHCLRSFPASRSFPVSPLFTSGSQKIGASASESVLSMSIQVWFPLGLTSLTSLLPKGLSRVFSNATIWKHRFFHAQTSLWSNSNIVHYYWKYHTFDYMDLCWQRDVSCFLKHCLALS